MTIYDGINFPLAHPLVKVEALILHANQDVRVRVALRGEDVHAHAERVGDGELRDYLHGVVEDEAAFGVDELLQETYGEVTGYDIWATEVKYGLIRD